MRAGLQMCARQRGGSASDAVLRSLFAEDSQFLRFIISGACAPLFLQGVIKDDSPVMKDCKKMGLDPSQCVVLTKIRPSDASKEGPLMSALKGAGINVTTVRMITKDRFLVELGRTRDEVERVGSEGFASDLCYHGKLLFQLYQSKGRSLNLPNSSARPGSGLPDEITVGGLQCAREIQWHVGESAVKAFASWRTTVGTMCEFAEGVKHRFELQILKP
jgi:hypothetical protein